MKKLSLLILMALALFAGGCHNKIWDELNDLNQRVTYLEKLCKDMNTNISSVQTIINVMQNGDYITGIVPVTRDGQTIGYTITFANHEPITIYNGETGETGQAGYVPQIGVAQDSDGVYYWTLDGQWLTDADGNKMPVTGTQGEKGDKGDKGNTGAAGSNGVTPQLKIENGDWYISYDNGSTWAYVGQATGDTGATGATGAAGQNGDSFFTSVTYTDTQVTFTMSNGTSIVVPRGTGNGGSVTIVNGAIMAEFSVSATKKVYFSKGNLKYSNGVWSFENSVTALGTQFAWGTSGYHDPNDQYNVYYSPTSPSYTSATISNAPIVNTTYNKYGYGPSTNMTSPNLTGASANYDWGVYNAISNGGNQSGQWRTLSNAEWKYVINGRTNASNLKFYAVLDGVNGVVLLPDNWETATKCTYLSMAYDVSADSGSGNKLRSYQWAGFASYGAVFLPLPGSPIYYYWSTTASGADKAWAVKIKSFEDGSTTTCNRVDQYHRVRLVKNVQ